MRVGIVGIQGGYQALSCRVKIPADIVNESFRKPSSPFSQKTIIQTKVDMGSFHTTIIGSRLWESVSPDIIGELGRLESAILRIAEAPCFIGGYIGDDKDGCQCHKSTVIIDGPYVKSFRQELGADLYDQLINWLTAANKEIEDKAYLFQRTATDKRSGHDLVSYGEYLDKNLPLFLAQFLDGKMPDESRIEVVIE